MSEYSGTDSETTAATTAGEREHTLLFTYGNLALSVRVDGEFEILHGASLAADKVNAKLLAMSGKAITAINDKITQADGFSYGERYHRVEKVIIIGNARVSLEITLNLTQPVPVMELLSVSEALLDTAVRSIYEVFASLNGELQDDESDCPCGGNCKLGDVLQMDSVNLSDLMGRVGSGKDPLGLLEAILDGLGGARPRG